MSTNCKILKIYPQIDVESRYNYHINYGLWDEIQGKKVILEQFNGDCSGYDVVFLPMIKRWSAHLELMNRIKSQKIKKVLFDNDSCYRTFDNDIYKGLDFIFYRCTDKYGNTPNVRSQWLPWSINTKLYPPDFTGQGIVMNCSSNKNYPLRQEIEKLLPNAKLKGEMNVKVLQKAAAGIHTDSPLVPMVRAKALEIAACGCEIISNYTDKMDYFYPYETIIYFETIEHLKEIIEHYQPNRQRAELLCKITAQRHDNSVRAKQVLQWLDS